MDLLRIAARVASDLTLVFIGVNWAPGAVKDGAEAVARMKALIETAGYKTGTFELEQSLDDGMVGNLEVEESFYSDHEDEGWEGSDGVVEVSMEVP